MCFLLSPGAAFVTGATLRVDAAGSLYSRMMVRISEHDKLPAYKWNDADLEEELPKSKL